MTRRRSFWSWLLNLPPGPPPARLTKADAVALASASPVVAALGRPLPVATAREEDGRVVWRVSSGGTGAQWWVEVDDATGAVGEIRHANTR